MTVLTVPSTGVKPDKEPLVPPYKGPWDCHLVGQRPPPEGVSTAEKIRQSYLFAWRLVLYIMVVIFIGMTVIYIRNATCHLPGGRRGAAAAAASENNKLAAADDPFEPYDAVPALLPSDADALSVLLPPSSVADDDLFKLVRFLGSARPPVAVAQSARFIHDFSVNITGVVDVEGLRCFVMPLVRDSVVPPSSLYDLLFKMSSGYYSMDMQKVMGGMRVVRPAVQDLSPYGLYIAKDCANKATYRLERADVASTTTVAATATTTVTDSTDSSKTTAHAALDRTED